VLVHRLTLLTPSFLRRHWKSFLQQNKTTAQLAEEFQACHVSQETATKLPFERFAGSITSAKTVKAAKDLLARLETRLVCLNLPFVCYQSRDPNS
jgi:hypothetical protein